MISKSQIKYIKSLHTKKARILSKSFIAEGVKTVIEIINEQPNLITELYCTESFYQSHEQLLLEKKITTNLVNSKELSQISQLSTPNETLVICTNLLIQNIETDLNKSYSFYLDDIRDPGNLGTIIRICSWFGVKDLFCSLETVELYNPKCIQSCMGAFLRVNVHYIELNELIKTQQINNIIATELKGKNIYKETLKSGLIIIGNEANGISNKTLSLSTQSLTIPSASSNTESLNAAIATSIIASEFFRRNL